MKYFALMLLLVLIVSCTQNADNGTQLPAVEPNTQGQQTEPGPSDVVVAEPEDQPEAISVQELSIHSSRDDCWVAYEGNVYDITDFLPRHPGTPEAIIPYCGTSNEFEAAFVDQHGTSKVTGLMRNQMMGVLG